MQTFTSKEYEYLGKLDERNYRLYRECLENPQAEQQSPWEPLEKPMSVDERKLRRSIRMKMTLFAEELSYAFHCFMPPEKQLVGVGVWNLETMVLLHKGICWLHSLEEHGDIREIISETKHRSYKAEYEFGDAGDLVKQCADELRDKIRTKNPELYDKIEKEEEQKRQWALK